VRSSIINPIAAQLEGGDAIYGSYNKKGWKAWGNKVDSGPDEFVKIARRYSSNEDKCLKRNLMVAIVSNTTNAQMLLNLENFKLSGYKLFASALLGITSVIVNLG